VNALKKRSFLLGTIVGLISGYFLKDFLDQNKNLSPEIVLDRVKKTFQRKGPVSGSWIYIHPNEYEKNGLIYDTYRGGITRTIDDQQKQFEFHADVKTGVVIDVQQTE